MKKRTTMLMSALFAAGAFALNGNVAKADNVQAVNNNNANSTEVKQNTVNADSSKLNVASAQTNNQADTKIPSKEQLKDTAMKQWNEYNKEVEQDPTNARKDYTIAVEDMYSRGGSPIVDGERLGGAISPDESNAILISKSDLKNYDWAPLNNQLNNAKEKLNTYLDNSVNKNTSELSNSRKEAAEALKNINIPIPSAPILTEDYDAVSSDSHISKARLNTNALGEIWTTINDPYLSHLIGTQTAIENSDYKNDEGFYSDKLAELVARNVRKDKNWVLANINPQTIRYGITGVSPEMKEPMGGGGEGADDVKAPEKWDTVLPYFIYNKELIKIDRDAYNRNNDIKSDQNTSDNKNQSTTDTKKDQSSEKVTNDTTSKKDQSTTSTSNTSSSNTNQTTESKSSTTSSKTPSDTKTSVSKNEGSNTKTTDVVKSENKATENTASVVKNDTKAATEKTTDVKVVAPAKNASNEVKTTDVPAKASDAHVVALNSKVNAGTTSTTPAAATKGSQAKATENKLPQAGTDEKISLFASLAGLSIASLGLGALGASKKRKND
ncbi:hypothetical protein ACRPK1_02520 [Lactobacillus johnsonii]|uniref:hypothetical protein n=1 Tax=Lactobacillus johnsonii TaxID=33959 RepID=UPI003D774F34